MYQSESRKAKFTSGIPLVRRSDRGEGLEGVKIRYPESVSNANIRSCRKALEIVHSPAIHVVVDQIGLMIGSFGWPGVL
jgi:hypothetical protein